jgi:hypothetical protein
MTLIEKVAFIVGVIFAAIAIGNALHELWAYLKPNLNEPDGDDGCNPPNTTGNCSGYYGSYPQPMSWEEKEENFDWSKGEDK